VTDRLAPILAALSIFLVGLIVGLLANDYLPQFADDREAGRVGEALRAFTRAYVEELPAEDLAARFGALGIGDDSRVVLYSRANMQWATRIWWMLRYVGFDNAAILDGGWEKWAHDKRPVETTPTVYQPATLTAKPRPELFVGRDEMLASIEDQNLCALNALGADLHRGENARYGRPGRIPGSVNVPAAELQHPETKEFVGLDAAARAFEAVGVKPDQRVLVYCGGGIAATLDAYLLHQLGYENIAVYDNSMSEWSTDDSLPIETG
jgi:thiosulfate/3-mercaptopyruvate sulfurtransferase